MKLHCPSKYVLLAIIVSITASGCSTDQRTTEPQQSNSNNNELLILPTSYDQQAELYEKILLGRIAAGRKLYDEALNYYLAALDIRGDIELAREALILSEQLKRRQSSLKSARIWVNLQPDALIPWKLITYYSISEQKIDDARVGIEKVIQLENNMDDLLGFFGRLSEGKNRTLALQLLRSLIDVYPDNPTIPLAIARIYQQGSQWVKAMALTHQIIIKQPELIIAWKFHGALLEASGAKEQAVEWYKKTLVKFPDSNDIQRNLGHLLYDLDRFPEARKQFKKLLGNFPLDNEARYMIAATYYSENNFTQSRRFFEPLLRIKRHRNAVLYYMGEMARKDSDIPSAINLYRQIRESRYYQTAHILVARLMQQQGHSQQALDYMKSLRLKDDDLDFRYMRALLAANMEDIEQAETDLRFILNIEPGHVDALNALGYTLADANKNLPEALALIEKAYRSNPESPAIIDSMGWVLYRLGNFVQALKYLQQAYALEPSDEIAAHLGEVLWNLDKKAEAIKIITTALQQTPESKVIIRTIKKYNIEVINVQQTEGQADS